jgi:protein-S-isoprenylcysteine O-methyltransferase Ste14
VVSPHALYGQYYPLHHSARSVLLVGQAWSWGLLAGWPLSGANGLAPLFYPVFLTILLVHRAIRDEEKCLAKYGAGYEEYMRLVPYKIVPFVY